MSWTTPPPTLQLLEAIVTAYRTYGWSLRIAPVVRKKRPRMLVLEES